MEEAVSRFVLRAEGWAQIFQEKERGDDLPGRRDGMGKGYREPA